MPRGRLPTVIVATTLLVCGEMTESVLAISLLTYSAGPAERAGRVSPIASRKGMAWVRLGDIAGFMRVYPNSVVENGLVDVQRLVQPAQAVAPTDPSQDRAPGSPPRGGRRRQGGARGGRPGGPQ